MHGQYLCWEHGDMLNFALSLSEDIFINSPEDKVQSSDRYRPELPYFLCEFTLGDPDAGRLTVSILGCLWSLTWPTNRVNPSLGSTVTSERALQRWPTLSVLSSLWPSRFCLDLVQVSALLFKRLHVSVRAGITFVLLTLCLFCSRFVFLASLLHDTGGELKRSKSVLYVKLKQTK